MSQVTGGTEASSETSCQTSQIVGSLDALTDLFRRRLMEDKAKARLIDELTESLRRRDDLDTHRAFAALFIEVLAAADRLAEYEATPELCESVREEILEVFARRGVDPIPTEGAFDAAIHEAISTVPTGDDEEVGTVAEVVSRGYMLGDKVLRPARVIVRVEDSATEPHDDKDSQ